LTDSVKCIQRLFRSARVGELECVRLYGPITQRNPRNKQMSTPPIIAPPPPPGGPIDPPALPASQWSIKSFDFVADATKQLIAVATGVITVTVLFSKDLNVVSRCFAFAAWSVLLLSVLFGILTLFTMSGELHILAKDAYGGGVLKEMLKDAGSDSVEDSKKEKRGIYEEGTRRASERQIVTFLFGMFLMLIFGAVAVGSKPNQTKDQPAPQNVTVTCVTPTPTPATPPAKDDGQKNNSGNRKKRSTSPHKSPLVCPPSN